MVSERTELIKWIQMKK